MSRLPAAPEDRALDGRINQVQPMVDSFQWDGGGDKFMLIASE
jgi:hypothetical protein